MKNLRLLFFAMFLGCFLPVLSYTQGIFIPPRTVTGTVNGITRPVAGATVTVCAANTAGLPCSPALANTVFKDSALTVPLANPFTTDANGNYPQAALAAGIYTITETASGFTGFSYQVSVACTPGIGCTINGIISGNLTVSGTASVAGALTTQSSNAVLYVGPGVGNYPTCNAAIGAAGSTNKTIIEVMPTYTGAACQNTITPNIMVRNFQGGLNNMCNPIQGFLNTCQAINWNVNDGNVNSLEKHESIFNTIPTNGAVLGLYALSHLQNATTTSGQGMDGFSGEANTWGTLTGTLGILSGHEADTTVHSTGGTINNDYGVQGHVNTAAASTTVITNAIGVEGIGCNSILGVVPTNCYGVRARDQFGKGSGRNYSLTSEGVSVFRFSQAGALKAGFDCEDNAFATHPCFFVDNSNVLNISPVNAVGINLNDSSATRRATVDGFGLLVGGQLRPDVAGARPIGTAALPWGTLNIGTAATNNFAVTPAATTQAITVNVADPGTPTVNLALMLKATSSAFATATTAGTCVQNTTAVTGAATTMAVSVSPVSTPGVGAVWSAFVSSAGNVTINECAVATSAGGTIAFNIRVFP